MSKLLLNPRLPYIAAALAILLTLPSLWAGLALDDYYARLVIHQPEPFNEYLPGPLDIFNFSNGDPEQIQRAKESGLAPWWLEPLFKGAFWRPISAVTHYLDNQLWPAWPWLMHLHSILWYALTVFLVALLYRRFMGLSLAAGLAAILFAIDDAHGVPVGFIANRNMLIACTFAVLALLLHDQWRSEQKLSAAAAASISYLAALLSAEAGVFIFGYLIAYAIYLDRASLHQRLISLIPYLSITIIWRLLWTVFDYGVNSINLYVDPISQPIQFMYHVIKFIPIFVNSLLLSIASEFQFIAAAVAPWLWLPILALAASSLVLLWRYSLKNQSMKFFALGCLLSLIPCCATLPQNRVLMIASIGTFALLGFCLANVMQYFRQIPRYRKFLAGALLLMHFVLSPMGLALASYMPIGPVSLDSAFVKLPDFDKTEGKTVIFVNHPLPMVQMYLTADRAVNRLPLPERSYVLAQAYCPIKVTRDFENALTIECEYGVPDYLTGVLGGMYKRFAKGERVKLIGLEVVVLEINEEGLPLKARIVFDHKLDDGNLVWYYWANDTFQKWPLPDQGATVTIQAAAIPFEISPAELHNLVTGNL